MTTIGGREFVGLLTKPVARVRVAQQAVPLWTVVGSAAIPLILTGSWAIAGVFQPPSYSPVRQTVSVLAGYAATDRWIVTSGLYLSGALYLAVAIGLAAADRATHVLLVVCGVAALGVAAFPEPAHGSNNVHLAFTGLGAVALAIFPAVVGRPGSRGLAALGVRATVVASVVSLALFWWTVVETHDGAALGLAERLSSALQVAWPFALAVALRRKNSPVVVTAPR